MDSFQLLPAVFQSAAFPMRVWIISLPVKISMLWPGLMPFLAKLSFSRRLLAKCGFPSVCTSPSLRSLVKSLLQSFKCDRWLLTLHNTFLCQKILTANVFLINESATFPFSSLVSGGQAASPKHQMLMHREA